MQRLLVIGIVLLFLGLIGLGIVRQEMGLAVGVTAVPTLALTFAPALQPAPATAAAIPATFTSPAPLPAQAGQPQTAPTAVPHAHTIQPGE
ncbi:MAG TPA: hypothetical protein PLK31_26415, partial [Chloroflexota bacterium]|nr:hypothetical protein [Chloroflexota bacterium]